MKGGRFGEREVWRAGDLNVRRCGEQEV